MKFVGVDIGGTFTDLALFDSESDQLVIHKVHSTPQDPGGAMISGIVELCDRAGVSPGDLDGLLHGTTVATNAVLEHRGALTGMVTTEGMRDVVHIGRHQRPQPYSVMQDIPWQASPFVRRRHRLPGARTDRTAARRDGGPARRGRGPRGGRRAAPRRASSRSQCASCSPT